MRFLPRPTFLIFTIVLGAIASAPFQWAVAQTRPLNLGAGLTPMERYERGVRKSGAFSVNDVGNCSPAAMNKIVPAQGVLKPLDFIYGIDSSGPRVAQVYIAGMLETLNRTIDVLVKLDDFVVASHHICAGLYNYGVFNAMSYGHGYILSDPRVIERMYKAPRRSMLSLDQVYLHEFAHQIQYWVGNPYLSDKNVRRSELAADCIGAGLLALTYRSWSPEILDMEALGVVHSAELVGDDKVKDPTHHGTSEERMTAVRVGMNYVRQNAEISSIIPWSMRIAAVCNKAVK